MVKKVKFIKIKKVRQQPNPLVLDPNFISFGAEARLNGLSDLQELENSEKTAMRDLPQ